MDAPAEGHAEVPSLLRQRMLGRASTFAEGVGPATPNSPRRRSSLLSTRSSTESLRTLRNNDMARTTTTPSSADTSWLHSSPVLVAIVPAIAALIHPNGGTITTDLVLLILSAWFLSKCVAAPWQWYSEAQQRQYVETDEPAYNDTIYEEEEDAMSENADSPEPGTGAPETSPRPSAVNTLTSVDPRESARAKLKRTEMMALTACFLAPLLGALFLHYLRSQFTHRARDGIVTDLNLGIYAFASEVRPTIHLFEMISKRTLHLQQLVMVEPSDESRPGTSHSLPQRIAELEARFEEPTPSSDIDVSKITNEVRQSMQHQLDALNRAVRKYEKRQLAQTMQIEARFQHIDQSLKDTLALAASAARTGQKPGIITTTLSWIASMFARAIQTAWDITTFPLRTANSILEAVQKAFTKDRRYPGRRTRAQLNGHASVPSTPRMQSKSGR